jgi:hypothetical protein
LHEFLLKFHALIPMYNAVYHKKKFPEREELIKK